MWANLLGTKLTTDTPLAVEEEGGDTESRALLAAGGNVGGGGCGNGDDAPAANTGESVAPLATQKSR